MSSPPPSFVSSEQEPKKHLKLEPEDIKLEPEDIKLEPEDHLDLSEFHTFIICILLYCRSIARGVVRLILLPPLR